MKTRRFFAAVVVGWAILSSISFGYSGGDGTAGNPYPIASRADLLTLAATTADYSKYFILTADIDMEGQVFTTAIIAPDTDNITSDYQGIAFTGTFDGNGHKITNFTINGGSNDYLGLFGYIDSDGTIENLGVENCTINGTTGSLYVGGLVGYIHNHSDGISNCYSTGSIRGDYYVGGLTGCDGILIQQCYSTAAVSGNYYIGGLAGTGSYIIYCYSTGTVNGKSWVGGLVGSYGYITNCYSTGAVYGESSVGGLTGTNNGTIKQCYATGTVSGSSNSYYIGGLAGSNGSSSIINQCYSIGAVSGTYNVGGLVGYKSGGSITDSFWDTETSGRTTSAGGTGKTTAQMKTLSTFTSAGWDFSPRWVDGDYRDWLLVKEGVDYPKLRFQVAWYHGGSGTAGDPYQIADASDFLALADDWWDWNKCFVLTNDIDMGGFSFTEAFISPDTGPSNTFFDGTSFTGTLDGNGHKITHFTITGTSGNDYLGLFGQIDSVGRIQNLGIESYSISGSGDSYYVGGLAGYNNGGTISQCHSTGSAYGHKYIGGLVGYDKSGRISQCYASGPASGSSSSSYVGGLVGYDYYGTIFLCYSTGTTIGYQYTGGLVGYNYCGSISYCYSTGNVNAYYNASYVGGLAGYNYNHYNSDLQTFIGRISQCYATGSVGGENVLGGLVGVNEGSISQCYSTGAIISGYDIYRGGLIAVNKGSISQCYSTGAISGTRGGGLSGNNSGTIANSFWDKLTSGRTTSAGGTGKTTAEMKTLSTFTSAGWDFSPAWIDGDWPDWVLVSEGITYPTLKWPYAVNYHGGSGTTGDPYQMADANDIVALTGAWWDWDKHFVLTSDIDMAGTAFCAAIIAPDTDNSTEGFQGIAFTGIFDGNGHKITHFTINVGSNDNLGLFGLVGSGGEIKNLGIEACSISIAAIYSYYIGMLAGGNSGNISNCYSTSSINVGSSIGYIGGLVGGNGGNITNCYSTGSVITGSYVSSVGGLAGFSTGGTISHCYSTGAVSSGSDSFAVGGLAGSTSATISQCYSTGSVSSGPYSYFTGGLSGDNGSGTIVNCHSSSSVSGSSSVGGLAGRCKNNTMSRCYSTGAVSGSSNVGGLVGYYIGTSSVTSCFWDTQTSGTNNGVGNIDPDPAGAMGKTTAQMKTLSTFTSTGWDFTNETVNGIEDIWRMCQDGINYPQLTWALDAGGDWMCPDGVGIEDLDQLCSCWVEVVQSRSDINNDDAVNLNDYQLLSQYWLMSGCGLCGGADITDDGNVNESDLMMMIEKWLLQENADCRMTDLNSDDKVNLGDWAIFAQHWLEGI